MNYNVFGYKMPLRVVLRVAFAVLGSLFGFGQAFGLDDFVTPEIRVGLFNKLYPS